MADRIEEVLSESDAWYNELPGGTERPRLLSKLAVLELCGWLEERFDAIAAGIAQTAGVEAAKAIQNRIDGTYGFNYGMHVRQIFLAIGGEVLVHKVESRLEEKYPGYLEQLKNALGQLWKQRCELAHGSSVAVGGQQRSVNAPSWAVNQQRVLGKMITKFEAEMQAAISVT